MIKSFIYLDEQKMYSLSSQLFEGITEYVLNESAAESEDSESQKGPVGSGKILADIVKKSSRSTEKKFLHDYSFAVFERHLEQEGRILEITSDCTELSSIEEKINDFSFVRVRARATFNDINKITELFSEFNAIGEALAHLGAREKLDQIKHEVDTLKMQTADRNRKSQLESEYKRLSNISALAKEQGLYQDPKFMSSLSLLTRYGFSDQFEIQQSSGEAIFTSCLKRDSLRETEEILIKKYSRKTEKEIVVFGVVTQAFSGSSQESCEGSEYRNMKGALMGLVDHLSNMERSISGKQDNEVIIDPIAVYFEV